MCVVCVFCVHVLDIDQYTHHSYSIEASPPAVLTLYERTRETSGRVTVGVYSSPRRRRCGVPCDSRAPLRVPQGLSLCSHTVSYDRGLFICRGCLFIDSECLEHTWLNDNFLIDDI